MLASHQTAVPETATSVVIHLPQRAQPGEPFTVTARIIPQDGVATPGSPDGDTDATGSPDASADGSTDGESIMSTASSMR